MASTWPSSRPADSAIWAARSESVTSLKVWVLRPRQKLAARFRWVVDQLGPVLERAAHFKEAAALYHRAIEGDPLSQPLSAGLARCAVRSL